MRNYVGLTILLALVTGAALWLRAIGLDIHFHDHYVAIPFNKILFWLVTGAAAVWLLIGWPVEQFTQGASAEIAHLAFSTPSPAPSTSPDPQ